MWYASLFSKIDNLLKSYHHKKAMYFLNELAFKFCLKALKNVKHYAIL